MKKIIALNLFFLSTSVFGQSVLDKTVIESCDCITESTDDVYDYDSYLSLIMKCASPSIMKNSDKLQKELGIEEKDEMLAIQEIGSKVGERLVMECPRFTEITLKVMGEDPTLLEEVIDNMDTDDYDDSDDSDLIASGTIISITKEIPCQISVKTDDGETLNFMWLEPISIEDEYSNDPDKLKGKKVYLVYYFGDLYDAKSAAYQSRKILIELTVQ